MFQRTVSFLPPEAVAGYLKTLVDLAHGMLTKLRLPHALTRNGDELADAVHTLAGSASMFGFNRLAAVGRRFERAIQSGSVEAILLADGLTAALEATLLAIREINPAEVVS